MLALRAILSAPRASSGPTPPVAYHAFLSSCRMLSMIEREPCTGRCGGGDGLKPGRVSVEKAVQWRQRMTRNPFRIGRIISQISRGTSGRKRQEYGAVARCQWSALRLIASESISKLLITVHAYHKDFRWGKERCTCITLGSAFLT